MFRRVALVALLWLGLGPASAAADPWAIPAPGSCEPVDGLRGWPPGEDAPPVPFHPGDAIALESLDRLSDFLPPFLWEYRDRFFAEGMRLEIGPCFADYSAPDFYAAATATLSASVRLDENGGLSDYTAGMPFPPSGISADDPQAGLQWAWNLALRYQAAGFRGEFRVSDIIGRTGRAEPFEGELFKAQLAFRGDRPDDEYTAPGSRGKHWVAGGQFSMPQPAREYTWRQYRDVDHLTSPDRSDDLHAYIPNLRRVRRIAATGVEGIYMPSFSVGVVQPQVLAGPVGGFDGAGGSAGAAGAVGGVAGSITTKRSGFEGLEIRPLLYSWKLLGVQDVLSPINAVGRSYPTEPDRDFGVWGLSFASDRWDLRRALVIEGTALRTSGGDQVARLVQYMDLQTQQPLYYVSYDSRGEIIDVGMYVGRWSEDRPDYPPWPDDAERPVRVIDSVGAAFANIATGGGWRRESWDMVSTPLPDREVKKLLSVGNLTKRR